MFGNRKFPNKKAKKDITKIKLLCRQTKSSKARITMDLRVSQIVLLGLLLNSSEFKQIAAAE